MNVPTDVCFETRKLLYALCQSLTTDMRTLSGDVIKNTQRRTVANKHMCVFRDTLQTASQLIFPSVKSHMPEDWLPGKTEKIQTVD